MVLQKKLDYRFNSYQVPTMPRASRSSRGRRLFKRKIEKNSMYAFNLLATVAGKLLQERETLPLRQQGEVDYVNGRKDSVRNNWHDAGKPCKRELPDERSCDESNSFFCDDASSKLVSLITQSDGSKKASCSKVVHGENQSHAGADHCIFNRRRGLTGLSEVQTDRIKHQLEFHHENETHITESMINGASSIMGSSEDPTEFDAKPLTLVSSDSSFEVRSRGDRISHHGSSPRYHADDNLANNDNDENSSECTRPSTANNQDPTHPCVGQRPVKALVATECHKGSPTISNDAIFSNYDLEMISAYHRKKLSCSRQRTQKDLMFKRRKVSENCLVSRSDDGNDSIYELSQKISDGKNVASSTPPYAADGSSSSVTAQRSSFMSGVSPLKLCIKSFKVPELFIEISETETVGALKRTVMEAISAVLGGGLRVGVVLQDKKVRDDNKTLLQAGISDTNKLDNLGFMLEPNSIVHSPSSCLASKEPCCVLPGEVTPPTARCPAVPRTCTGVTSASPELLHSKQVYCTKSCCDSVPTPHGKYLDETPSSSKALVAVSSVNVEALTVVPVHLKSRRSELVQRRIRRPFSVSEVEALVQAVEKLGTGRWRDVKLRAFENVKHRTYVDLKDKWKTLVHTARISPQQRRGEPVPQELLDRVLLAHAYWSQQQAKQQACLFSS